MADIISQKEAHALERAADNKAEQQKKRRFFMSELAGGIGGGFMRGYLLTKNPTLAAFGPGGRLNIDMVMAAAGIFIGRKQTKMAAVARGAGIQALGHIGSSYGEKAATDGP